MTGAPRRAVTGQYRIEDLLREFAPQVLTALIRRHGQFDACEDAVQEALPGHCARPCAPVTAAPSGP